MALDFGGLFPQRSHVEGTSPDTYDINWDGALTQNITNALAVDSFTTNHTNTGSILSFYDSDSSSTYWQWHATGEGEEISTIVLDLGQEVYVHNTIMNFGLDEGNGTDVIITTYYSSDKSSWTQIDTDTYTSNTLKNFDHYLIGKKFRYLRIVGETNISAGYIRLYRLRLIR